MEVFEDYTITENQKTNIRKYLNETKISGLDQSLQLFKLECLMDSIYTPNLISHFD